MLYQVQLSAASLVSCVLTLTCVSKKHVDLLTEDLANPIPQVLAE